MMLQLLANQEKAETNRKADLENLKRMMEEMLRANQDGLQETIACNGATETESDPGMMQSTEEHYEISMGDAAVMPVGEPRKRRRVGNLTAKGHEKRKERMDPRGSRLPPAESCPAVQ
jgi:hypothetical protein